MAQPTLQPDLKLRISEAFSVPVERLYAAWSKPEFLQRWFAPGDMRVPEASADVRVGGRYRIVMQEPGGARHIVGGEYLEVAENRCLAFTWQWEGSPVTTRVRVEFRAAGKGGSEFVLTHGAFIEEDARDKHGEGWAGCLANLRRFLAA